MTACSAVVEQVCPVACEGLQLPGILSLPRVGAPRVGVLVLVGGPQYRIGAHRFFVSLARQLAGQGAAVLRFDHRGMGDAPGEPPGFEQLDPEIDAGIAALQQACPGVDRVLLWGLCDGAAAALLHARRGDARVAGMLLANPWVRSERSLARARTRHYYPARLASADFWRRLLSGQVRWSSLRSALGALSQGAATGEHGGDFRSGMREGLGRFQGRVLCLLSSADLSAQEFIETLREPDWAALGQRPGFSLQWLDEADHTFSDPEHRAAALDISVQWLRGHLAAEASTSDCPAGDPAVI